MADNQQYGPLTNKQTSASDIRSVIANATKKSGAGMTIATKDELNTKKADKQTANKVKTANIATNKSNPSAQNIKRTVVNNKGATITKINPQQNNTTTATKAASLTQGQLSGDLFKNPAVQPIKDIPIVNEDGKATKTNKDIKTDMFINSTSRANELKTPIDIDNALMDLYQDVNQKVHNGTIASSDIAKLKQVYQEFSNMDDETVLQLVGTMASMAKKNLKFNDTNMKKLKSLFPELTSAAWGFDKQADPNMYQAGGVREQISAGSATDLNKYGAPGMVAESVMNPVGEATTLADTAIQSIPQIDSNTDFTGTKDLQAALKKLTKEDINNYYKQYLNYVQEHPYVSQLYTTTVEGDNLLEQLGNVIPSLFKDKTKDDLRSGFRSWLIDRINNEVNGWSGEFWGAANELKGNSGPNIAKMYANMPASTVKTVSAVTRALTNPIDTAAGLVQLFGTEEGRNALAARYGSWDAFAKAMEQDPVGVASDALAVVEGGAGATKFVAGASSKGALAAALATETLGATRSTESLLKLASRLEYLMTKAEGVEKIAGLSSNLGADIGVKGGNVRIGNKNFAIKGVINGLKEWGENGDSLLRKAAKYSGKTAETGIGEIYKEGKEVVKEGPINTIANKLMGSASDSDKLFKAASPNLNTLRNNVDYKNKRNNMDIATNAIVEAGYVPKTLSEWAKAHTETLNKKWNEFKQLVADKADVMVDVKDIIEDVRNYIKSEREGATELQKQDLRKLEVEVDALAKQGKLSMEMIEKKKEHYNSSWRDADKLKVGDVYLRGLKMLGNAMRKQQDNILGKGPESTKKLRKEIAALMDTKNDVIKADVRNQKKKSDISGGGLVESYGRLSGLGDVIGGVTSGILGGKGAEGFAQAGKGLGKMVLGKAMGKAKDVDYLTQKGFEGLSKKKGLGTTKDGGLRSKVKDRRELGDLLVERDNLKKELKNEKLSEEDRKKLKDRFDDVEYAIAQKKARSGLGDKEEELNAESKKKVIDMVQKRANDVGFTTKVLDGMEKDTQGYTDLRKKLIALEKNPGDTTAQHELFHAFFSVVDDKTKTYILDEAKKILKDSGMADKNAEEWLAESFGIYAKRKQIKLGLIDAPKGFVAKVRNFFQKVYEYMQRFNGDRATINKLFDEVLGDRQMKSGIMDLSELLGDKEVKGRKLYSELGDNGLRNKSVYHGSPADFDKFDSSHMGEGEGAQAHGWGHYVAVEERTGRHYADMGGEPSFEYNGKKIWELKGAEREVANSMETNITKWDYDFEESKSELKERYENGIKRNKERLLDNGETEAGRNVAKKEIEKYKEMLNVLDKMDEKNLVLTPNRHLYTNDIPDPVKKDTPTGSNYWEEDRKLTNDEFDKVITELYKQDAKAAKIALEIYGNKEAFLADGKHVYHLLSDATSPKEASKFLESLGYDGIHYHGGRDGEAYVIFNDDALKIKEHIRYKKKIGDKEVEINKDITSPDQMAKVNSKGLSVIHDFISEKQAEKALDVSKDILDEDGNAYLWTHTNKYVANQFANFENVKDSKYKEFSDKEISWFSNSEEMSKSYANQQSVLANTKSPKTEEEFNKFIKSQELVNKGEGYEQKQYFKVEKNSKGNYVVTENDITKQKDKNLINFASIELGEAGKVLESMAPEDIVKRIEERAKNNGDYIKISNLKEKNGSYYIDYESETKLSTIGTYKDKEELYAKVYSKLQPRTQYHYQGIVQNMKNPLIVDYRNPEGTKTYWNKLGSAYEFLEKTDKSQLNKLEKALDEAFGMREEGNIQRRKVWDKIEEESHRLRKEYQKASNAYQFDKPGDAGAKRELERADYLRDSFNKYQNVIYEGLYREFTTNELAQLKDLDVLNQWGKFIDLVNGYREKYKGYDIFNTYRGGIGLEKFLEQKGFSKDIISLTHDLPTYDHSLGENIKNGKYALTEKQMQTNDYVFYALNKGDYDGVLFKDISDYGGEGTSKRGGDVLATFNSKQFKAWDNSTPTDSKYISYKKKVSLDKKPGGLSKKDSNGLLAKGRERLGDNGMRYKKEVPEDKKLVGLHNLGIDKLRGVIELGGMPMPSIAVTKKGVPHESYGDITFIMKESAINPALSRKNKLYTVDGYTPTVPQPTIKVKDTKEANLLMDKIQKETGIGYGELMQWLEYHDDRYFKDYPKLKEFDKYYDQLTEKKLFDGFTYTGKRRYKDYNLDNIVKSMVGNKRDAFNGAFWKMVAQSQGNTTVEKLRDRKYGLKDKDLAEKIGERYYDALKELASKKGIEQKIENLSDYGRFAENVSDAYRANTDAWWRELTQWDGAEGTIYSKITKEDLEPLQKIIKEAAELPRPYSEAKPERAIRFDEVGAVVAPEGKLKEVKDMLKDTGLKVYGYKEGERMSVVDKVADDNGLRFKKKVDQTQTPEFKKWFEGSKVVDKSGKPLEVYHGSYEGGFNIFDKKLRGSATNAKSAKLGFFFTDNESLAKEYSKRSADGQLYKVYLDMKNPLIKDFKGENVNADKELTNLIKEAKSNWNDGVIAKNLKDGFKTDNQYVVFEPNQIKSATDNIGTFDKNNPDIRYKKNSEGKDLSEGQIKYFADSKVRNDKGELLVVYRGTKNIEGDRFLYSKDHQTGEDFGKAYYFTTNKDQARGYSFDDTKTQAYKDWWKQRNEYHNKYLETKDEKYRKLRDEWSHNNGLHLRDVNEMDKHPEGFGETRAYYLNIKNPLEYDAKGETWGVYEKLFKEFKEDRKWRGAEYGYDGIIIHNVKDNSVKRNGELEDMDVYITFNQNQAKYTDNLNPTTKLSKRLKKKVGLEKKGNGLEKKGIRYKTSSLGRHSSEIDNFAKQLGVEGGTELEKMKTMNKLIKDPKYKGTKIKKELYALKWQIKKEYIMDNNKKIKDGGPNNTKLVVWQNGKKATWHFIPSQYYELRRMGAIK